MVVKQLIELLSECDPDMPVVVDTMYDTFDVMDVFKGDAGVSLDIAIDD